MRSRGHLKNHCAVSIFPIAFTGISFYQRKEIKDLMGYLKLTVNPHDEETFKKVVNYPARGIGKTTMEKIIVFAADNDRSLWDIAENIALFPFPQGPENRSPSS